MPAAIIRPFQCPHSHEAVSRIIRDRSTNPRDIREVALEGLDLSRAREILDLGCGFGFLAERLVERLPGDARLLGVDVWPDNEEVFCRRVSGGDRRAEFRCLEIETKLPWPDRSFDLVVCSYSLYFFPEAIGDIARVLRKDGLLLAITHSERSVRRHLGEAGLAEAASGLAALTAKFSAENGRQLLGGSFGRISRVDYDNQLRFSTEHREDLKAYLRFKLPLLVPDTKPGDDLPESLNAFLEKEWARHGAVVIEKNDAIFRCGDPR